MPFKDPVIRKQRAVARAKAWSERNPEKRKELVKTWRYGNPQYWLWSAAKRRAKRDNLEFTLSREDIPEIPEICPIAQIPLYHNREGTGGPCDNSPTLDRVDCTKGYTKDNICVISFKANRWKNNMTFEDIKYLIAYIEARHPGSLELSAPPTPEPY